MTSTNLATLNHTHYESMTDLRGPMEIPGVGTGDREAAKPSESNRFRVHSSRTRSSFFCDGVLFKRGSSLRGPALQAASVLNQPLTIIYAFRPRRVYDLLTRPSYGAPSFAVEKAFVRYSLPFESEVCPDRTILGSKAPLTIVARDCHQRLRTGPMSSLGYTCASVAESALQEA